MMTLVLSMVLGTMGLITPSDAALLKMPETVSASAQYYDIPVSHRIGTAQMTEALDKGMDSMLQTFKRQNSGLVPRVRIVGGTYTQLKPVLTSIYQSKPGISYDDLVGEINKEVKMRETSARTPQALKQLDEFKVEIAMWHGRFATESGFHIDEIGKGFSAAQEKQVGGWASALQNLTIGNWNLTFNQEGQTVHPRTYTCVSCSVLTSLASEASGIKNVTTVNVFQEGIKTYPDQQGKGHAINAVPLSDGGYAFVSQGQRVDVSKGLVVSGYDEQGHEIPVDMSKPMPASVKSIGFDARRQLEFYEVSAKIQDLFDRNNQGAST